jgi:hypothetical protein
MRLVSSVEVSFDQRGDEFVDSRIEVIIVGGDPELGPVAERRAEGGEQVEDVEAGALGSLAEIVVGL